MNEERRSECECVCVGGGKGVDAEGLRFCHERRFTLEERGAMMWRGMENSGGGCELFQLSVQVREGGGTDWWRGRNRVGWGELLSGVSPRGARGVPSAGSGNRSPTEQGGGGNAGIFSREESQPEKGSRR